MKEGWREGEGSQEGSQGLVVGVVVVVVVVGVVMVVVVEGCQHLDNFSTSSPNFSCGSYLVERRRVFFPPLHSFFCLPHPPLPSAPPVSPSMQ
ncbi:hypothetical protein E2C01_074452 [Portunus trituberculatus]|uniref:Uncharacterized protein n=1 Tax=Portunus trituberculatus TaxID=210409 RepID=A0A5B7IGC2_PORTR|nr:hypothetical protein [Portunus trituberculatus]